DNTVTDNGTSDQPDADGITVRRSVHAAVRGNTVSGSTGNAIALGTSDDRTAVSLDIEDNTVLRNQRAGITAFLGGAAQVIGNTVMHCGSSGLSVETQGTAAPLTVADNTLGSNGSDGIFLRGATSGAVRNNISVSNGATGVTLRGAAQMLLA